MVSFGLGFVNDGEIGGVGVGVFGWLVFVGLSVGWWVVSRGLVGLVGEVGWLVGIIGIIGGVWRLEGFDLRIEYWEI